MTLAYSQREKLLDFIKSKYVDYHDVRLLIAKDLEEDITKQMEVDETITFDVALDLTYSTYGVVGFSNVSEKYMKQIRKHFYKVMLELVKIELSSVKYWIYASLFFVTVYLVLMFLDLSPFIYAGVLLVLFIVGFIISFSKIHKHLKEQKKKESYYYFDEMLLSNNSILFPAIYLPIAVAMNLKWITDIPALSMAILALATTISFTGIYIIIFAVYKKRTNIINAYKLEYLSDKTRFDLNLI
jgi:hypothetical protein